MNSVLSDTSYLAGELFLDNSLNRDKANKLKHTFPFLNNVLRQDTSLGISIDGSNLQRFRSKEPYPKSLKDYFADSSTELIIEHNRKWALGDVSHPIFQFAYLMLPTPCNQKCHGCFMGKDKGRLPDHLSGPYFSKKELSDILLFLKNHGTRAIVFAGGGELFAWEGAFDFIETVNNFGLRMILFTNGTLLSKKDVSWLNSIGVVLMISLRDTNEAYHNAIVGTNGFHATLSTIENALSEGFHKDNRLAIEIPVTKNNESRVLNDFLPVVRSLGIVPIIEEFIQISTSDDEKTYCHNFNQSREFFEKLRQADSEYGISWVPEVGQRMIAQPKCRRPLYSFAIFPSGDVMDCPSHSVCYGTLRNKSLEEIIYSEKIKKRILDFDLCACSVFHTNNDSEIPDTLPDYLEVLR